MRESRNAIGLILMMLCLLTADLFAQPPAASGSPATIEALLRSIEAQGRTQEALLRSLLEEAQQNRMASQLNSVNLYRLQMLNESLNSQQSRVDSLTTELDLLTQQLEQASDSFGMDDQLPELESAIQQATDPTQRQMLLQSYQTTKRAIELQKEQLRKERERNQLRQQNLQVRLQQEKARLAELEEKISAMDRHFQNVTAELVRKGAR